MVSSYLRGAHIKADGWLPEDRLSLLALLSLCDCPSSFQAASDHTNSTGDVVSLEAGIFLPHRVIDKVVQRVLGKDLMLPSHVTDVVEDTHEGGRKLSEGGIVFETELDRHCALHIIRLSLIDTVRCISYRLDNAKSQRFR